MAGDNESSIVVNDAHLAIRDVFEESEAADPTFDTTICVNALL